LKGLRERAEMIGASLEVGSRPEQGTTVRLELGT
jgi:signal transduction histidine kinase